MRLLSALLIMLAACGKPLVRQVGLPAVLVNSPTDKKVVAALAFDNNKSPVYYAAADVGGKISVFNLVDSKPFSIFEHKGEGLLSLAFTNTNDSIISAFNKGGIVNCQIYTKQCSTIYSGVEPGIFSAFLPTTDEFIYQTEANRLDFIGGPSWRVLRSTPLPSAITAFSLDYEKKNFIAGLKSGDIIVWSVMGRGLLAQTALSPRVPIMLVKPFSYSELPDGGLGAVKDPRRVVSKEGVVVLDIDGTFHLFALTKEGNRRVLKLINTVKSGLNPSYSPVMGAGSADYLPFSDSEGKLRFFAFETVSLEYEDKDFAAMTSGMPVSGDSAVMKVRLILPNLEEKQMEDLKLRPGSLVALDPDGKYFLAGDSAGETSLIRNPVVVKQFKKLAENAEFATKAKKYDLAITLYSQALGLYLDKELEDKRDKVWEDKRAADAERFNKTQNLQKGR